MGEEKEHKQKQNREHMFETYSYKNLLRIFAIKSLLDNQMYMVEQPTKLFTHSMNLYLVVPMCQQTWETLLLQRLR